MLDRITVNHCMLVLNIRVPCCHYNRSLWVDPQILPNILFIFIEILLYPVILITFEAVVLPSWYFAVDHHILHMSSGQRDYQFEALNINKSDFVLGQCRSICIVSIFHKNFVFRKWQTINKSVPTQLIYGRVHNDRVFQPMRFTRFNRVSHKLLIS